MRISSYNCLAVITFCYHHGVGESIIRHSLRAEKISHGTDTWIILLPKGFYLKIKDYF